MAICRCCSSLLPDSRFLSLDSHLFWLQRRWLLVSQAKKDGQAISTWPATCAGPASQNYAANYAPNLPIMLKLCPLFLKGANLYVQIIILLSYIQCHSCITNLGAYTGRSTSRVHGPCTVSLAIS